MKADIIVLGAGIVGICAAIHLQDRGRKVIVVDRREPGEEASYGNAGLIQNASVVPYGFPRDLAAILRYGSNRSTSMHYDLRSLPSYLPWLYRYWKESAPIRHARAGCDMLPLIRASVSEHRALIERAGLQRLIRESGWLEAFRTSAVFAREARAAAVLSREHKLKLEILDAAALRKFEPAIRDGYVGAVHWLDPITVTSPGDLTKGYAELFQRCGGLVVKGDAKTLDSETNGWSVQSNAGKVFANSVVVALGAWSDTVFRKLGYRIPLMPKRGYHMHYVPAHGPELKVPVIDIEEGYAVAPMKDGLRISTGVELASRDAAPTPVQLERAERSARPIFGFGGRVHSEPWYGSRPCTPDMRPVIGKAPRHSGLWFSFGHNHHGFTLGPPSGRLLAEMMTSADTFADPTPFLPDRFG